MVGLVGGQEEGEKRKDIVEVHRFFSFKNASNVAFLKIVKYKAPQTDLKKKGRDSPSMSPARKSCIWVDFLQF